MDFEVLLTNYYLLIGYGLVLLAIIFGMFIKKIGRILNLVALFVIMALLLISLILGVEMKVLAIIILIYLITFSISLLVDERRKRK